MKYLLITLSNLLLITTTCGQNVSDGLVYELTFSDTIAETAAGSALNIQGAKNLTHNRFGTPHCAWDLTDSASNYLSFAIDTPYFLGDSIPPHSISVWMKQKYDPFDVCEIRQLLVGFDKFKFGLGLYDLCNPLVFNTNQPVVELWDDEWNMNADSLKQLDRWFHILYTFDGATTRYYRDGVLKDSLFTGRDSHQADSIFIGLRYEGAIDDIRIYNRVLHPAEVDLLYHGIDSCCGIWDISTSDIECPTDSTYTFTLDCKTQNITSDSFELHLRSGIYNTYSYDTLPLRLTLDIENTLNQYIKIKDAYEGDCYAEHEFEVECASANECRIFDLTTTNIECPNDSTYILTIDFEYENVTNDFFDLRLRSGIFDSYRYEDLPIRITLPLDPNPFQYIKINDNDNLDCFKEIEFEVECASANECRVFDLTTTNIECPNDSTYILTIDFEYENVTNDFFDLRLRSGIFDSYRYEDLPIRITLPLDHNPFQYIKINDNDNLDCFKAIEFEVDCTTSVSQSIKRNYVLYPNPIYSSLQIKGLQNNKIPYRIIHQSGKVVQQGQTNSNGNISVVELPSGYYIIRILDRKDVIYLPFIKL